MKDTYIYDAVQSFGELAGIQNTISIEKREDVFQLRIRQIDFLIAAKKEIRISSKGIVLQQLKDLQKQSDKPIIVVSNYIALEVADELRDSGINYIDRTGNSYVKHADFLFYISGQKALKIPLTNQARAFRESGIRLIFLLLSNPDFIHLPNRRLSELSGISVGSVSNVMNELESLNFVLKAGDKRHLKNLKVLLDRWIISYLDVLRPRLLMKRMRFEFEGDYLDWQNLPLQNLKCRILWGGEPAAALKTINLNPRFFTIYTDRNWQEFAKDLRLIPDESGNLEILEIFWEGHDIGGASRLVGDLLIYSDLIGSGIERNIQIANEILENDLQYIK